MTKEELNKASSSICNKISGSNLSNPDDARLWSIALLNLWDAAERMKLSGLWEGK
jgi:hypothetical protein